MSDIDYPDDIDWGPKTASLENGEPCPECGYPMGDDWKEVWYSGKGIQYGEETWKYECPGCEQATCIVGT